MLFNFNKIFTIVPVEDKDYWKLCNFAVANEERLKAYFPLTLAKNLTPELSKIFATTKAKNFKERSEFLFLIRKDQVKDLVGMVYIKEVDFEKKQGEFAYCIGYQFEGQGIVSKAIKALSNYAFDVLGLETLQIISHKSNLGSIKVAEKNNFIWKETLPKEYTPPNKEALDMELYELYKS
ncbi:GNAT family N-acetyltransferase [Ichthyenterobacterium sp. W332]|uniref:GNAT family N-acetyltransferase n=1 Tax=Microcosmobacter mediterraneus TaxID=3075607 RepID=A0ABU2YIA0_9FLAO|nr:GNAT family N-acetyltransferase [Ichthyenterobacterium sp. W332]MDT0557904.1 GNAT family N-acetyltransferase [Ichthyenterobacterium sp. W332]